MASPLALLQCGTAHPKRAGQNADAPFRTIIVGTHAAEALRAGELTVEATMGNRGGKSTVGCLDLPGVLGVPRLSLARTDARSELA